MKKIGFIGCGHMGSAMISAMLKNGVDRSSLRAGAKSEKTRQAIEHDLGICAADNEEIAAWAEVLFLAVKPQVYPEVITQIRSLIAEDTIVVSIAPGKTLAWLEEAFGRSLKFVRLMPNTPAMVGAGMTGMCSALTVSEEDRQIVRSLCESFGRAEEVSEAQMDAVTAISGSSPAYVYMFIEAMADAGVLGGLSRSQAYTFAAQAVLGSAQMVLETGQHPGVLKDAVCSPGGTTIEAVRVLEEKGLRSAVMEAMKACLDKSRGM